MRQEHETQISENRLSGAVGIEACAARVAMKGEAVAEVWLTAEGAHP